MCAMRANADPIPPAGGAAASPALIPTPATRSTAPMGHMGGVAFGGPTRTAAGATTDERVAPGAGCGWQFKRVKATYTAHAFGFCFNRLGRVLATKLPGIHSMLLGAPNLELNFRQTRRRTNE
jgi:hypothetical protein